MLFTLFKQATSIHYVFPSDHVVAMRIPARRADDVRSKLAAVAGVTDVTLATEPLGGGTRVRATTGSGAAVALSRVGVGARFFETLGIPITRGRSFDAGELRGHAAVAVISESAARQLAPDRDVLGSVVALAGTNERLVVIGIARDAIDYGVLPAAGAFAPSDIYAPYAAPEAAEVVLLAHVATDARVALRPIAAAAPTAPGVRPMRPVLLSDEVNQRRGTGTMQAVAILFGFSVLTLLLAASGVFAVISQSMAQRTREFGIRMAIGATSGGVLWMVLRRESKLIALAIATGVIFAMALTQAMFAELVRVSAILPSMWIGSLLLSGGVAAMAVAFATYRIVRLEPSVVLRRL